MNKLSPPPDLSSLLCCSLFYGIVVEAVAPSADLPGLALLLFARPPYIRGRWRRGCRRRPWGDCLWRHRRAERIWKSFCVQVSDGIFLGGGKAILWKITISKNNGYGLYLVVLLLLLKDSFLVAAMAVADLFLVVAVSDFADAETEDEVVAVATADFTVEEPADLK